MTRYISVYRCRLCGKEYAEGGTDTGRAAMNGANQDDYPRRYVARLWDMSVPTSTQYMALEDTLEELRKTIPAEMSRLPAAPDDSIVEAWL